MSRETESPVVLVTGAARRIGAEIARHLHAINYNVVVHYQNSSREAEALCSELNTQRQRSAHLIQASLNDLTQVRNMATEAIAHWGRMDALVNNASSFYPTPLDTASENQWNDLLGSNLQGPYFLSQALSQALMASKGAIVNISDIHARQPLANHSIYCIAKAGNAMLTKTMAKELAPLVRVNGIAPGAILWPETEVTAQTQQNQADVIQKIPLQRMGAAVDIAHLTGFFLTNATYITGQIIAVDGGKQLIL